MILRALVLWLLLFKPVHAQTADAAAAATMLEEAAAQLVAAQSARDRVRALTETVQAYEVGLIAMRDGLRRAALAEQRMSQRLAAREQDIARLLGVLQTMERAPAPLLLLHPAGPLGTARGGMIAADLTPALQEEVRNLRGDLAQISALRQARETGTQSLLDGLQGAQSARAELSKAISERRDLPRRFADDPVQTSLLLSNTQTLEGFATALSDAFLTSAPAPVAATPEGIMPLPVQGRVLRGSAKSPASP